MDADFDRDYYAPIGSIRRAEREAREALFSRSFDDRVKRLDNPRHDKPSRKGDDDASR